ncbi:alpha-amylase family glycosyl hydrolase [Actinomycetes bacterium NPDC127524]
MKRKPLFLVILFFMFCSFLTPAHSSAADYSKVVVRGSEAPLDWGSDNNQLAKQSDGTWISKPIPLAGGKKLEFKYVRDGNWMDGDNLTFTPPQSGNYVFVFHPDNERTVDLKLTEAEGKVTLNLTVPASAPSWAVPSVASSLNNFNYGVTYMKRTGDRTWTLTLTGNPGETFTYLYGLGDMKYAEDRQLPREAVFSKEGTIFNDTISSFKAVPVANNVSHNYDFMPKVPDSKDNVRIKVKAEHYGPIDKGGIYYTTDGSSPSGKRGKVLRGHFVPLTVQSSSKNEEGMITTVFSGMIPKQKNQTRVKYKTDIWYSKGQGSQFADTNSLTAEDATEFAYYVDQFKSPDWAKTGSIYQIFVDRFMNGNLKNDDPKSLALPYDERLKGWMGGDLAGVKEKLGYIQSLGIKTIWISPVFEGPYSHGYHPASFTKIDRRFGDEQLMKSIIKEAHRRGMKAVYDLVPNHTSNQHPFFKDAQKNGEKSPYYKWYTFTHWPDKYETFSGVSELPQLNNDNPDTRNYMLKTVVPFWLKNLGFDGFRLDYAKGPSYSFWVDFRYAVKRINPNAYIFGEVWDSREKISTYAGKLDGALDFPMQGALSDVFAKNKSMKELGEAITSNEKTYPKEFRMNTFLDNHDMPRFLFEAGGDTNKLKLAAAAQFTLPGTPVIYYGTEVGLSQSKDHNQVADYKDRYFREMMPWDPKVQNQELKKYYQQWISLRNHEIALQKGTYKQKLINDNVLVFERIYKKDRLLVVINKSQTQPVKLGSADFKYAENAFTHKYLKTQKTGSISLPAVKGTVSVYKLSSTPHKRK